MCTLPLGPQNVRAWGRDSLRSCSGSQLWKVTWVRGVWLISSPSFHLSCICCGKLGTGGNESPGDQFTHFPFPVENQNGWGTPHVTEEASMKTTLYSTTCKKTGCLPSPPLSPQCWRMPESPPLEFYFKIFILLCLSVLYFRRFDFGKGAEKTCISSATG